MGQKVSSLGPQFYGRKIGEKEAIKTALKSKDFFTLLTLSSLTFFFKPTYRNNNTQNSSNITAIKPFLF